MISDIRERGSGTAAVAPAANEQVRSTLAFLPTLTCVLSSCFERDRAGAVVDRVMQCSDEPLHIGVAMRKGHKIDPIIRDSHHFGLSILGKSDKQLTRRFSQSEGSSEVFDAIETFTLASRSPLLKKAVAVIDCEVVRHFDLEADYELFIGLVLAARVC
ncbi:MAG: flavin reductase [Phycisphaerales bacterium]|nr:flavin reductase [Phycisphaerales bacterium]